MHKGFVGSVSSISTLQKRTESDENRELVASHRTRLSNACIKHHSFAFQIAYTDWKWRAALFLPFPKLR